MCEMAEELRRCQACLDNDVPVLSAWRSTTDVYVPPLPCNHQGQKRKEFVDVDEMETELVNKLACAREETKRVTEWVAALLKCDELKLKIQQEEENVRRLRQIFRLTDPQRATSAEGEHEDNCTCLVCGVNYGSSSHGHTCIPIFTK